MTCRLDRVKVEALLSTLSARGKRGAEAHSTVVASLDL